MSNPKQPTEKEWEEFVVKNSKDSYSMAVVICVLMLWESGVNSKSEAHRKLMQNPLSDMLSGFQAENIIALAMTGKPDFVKTLSEQFEDDEHEG